MSTALILIFGFLILLFLEKDSFVPKENFWKASLKLLLMYSILVIGVTVSKIENPGYGMLVAISWMLVLFLLELATRHLQNKVSTRIVQVFTITVFAITTFHFSSLYFCSVEHNWYILGKNATLIHQLDGSKTLCHESVGAQYDTECHSFKGGYHGLYAEKFQ